LFGTLAAPNYTLCPLCGSASRALLKAARDALEELVRAEEICKILNSFNMSQVPGL